MRRAIIIASLAVISIFTVSCYHATIETGLVPSAQTAKIWAQYNRVVSAEVVVFGVR
jgi:hypothetical protein